MNEKLNNVEWSFTLETGCLTITGTGKMQNWAEHQERPWEEIRDEIRRVRICVGMESVGDCAFQNCTSLTSIKIGDNISDISAYAFANSPVYENQYKKGIVYIGKCLLYCNTEAYKSSKVTVKDGTCLLYTSPSPRDS